MRNIKSNSTNPIKDLWEHYFRVCQYLWKNNWLRVSRLATNGKFKWWHEDFGVDCYHKTKEAYKHQCRRDSSEKTYGP